MIARRRDAWMRWWRNGARLILKQYAKDGDSAKEGKKALAKGVATNQGCAMAQLNESATNRREGLATGAARDSAAGRRDGAAKRISDDLLQGARAIGAKRIDKLS